MKFLIRYLLGSLFKQFIAQDESDRAQGKEGRRRANIRLHGCLTVLLAPLVVCALLSLTPYLAMLGVVAGIIPATPTDAETRKAEVQKKQASQAFRKQQAADVKATAATRAEQRKTDQAKTIKQWTNIPEPWNARKTGDLVSDALWVIQLPADDVLDVGFRHDAFGQREQIYLISKTVGGFTRPPNGSEAKRWFLPPDDGAIANAVVLPDTAGSLLMAKTDQWLFFDEQNRQFRSAGRAPSEVLEDLTTIQSGKIFAHRKGEQWLIVQRDDQTETALDNVLDLAFDPQWSNRFAYSNSDGSVFIDQIPPGGNKTPKRQRFNHPAAQLLIANGQVYAWGEGYLSMWNGYVEPTEVEFPADEIIAMRFESETMMGCSIALVARRGDDHIVAVFDDELRPKSEYVFSDPVVSATVNNNGRYVLVLFQNGLLKLFPARIQTPNS